MFNGHHHKVSQFYRFVYYLLFVLVDISRSLYTSFPPQNFTVPKCNFRRCTCQYHRRFSGITDSNSLTSVLGLWMVHIYGFLLRLMTTLSCATERDTSPKVASSLVISTLMLSIRCVGGMDRSLTVHCGGMPLPMTLRCLLTGTSLGMQGSLPVTLFLFHTMACATI